MTIELVDKQHEQQDAHAAGQFEKDHFMKPWLSCVVEFNTFSLHRVFLHSFPSKFIIFKLWKRRGFAKSIFMLPLIRILIIADWCKQI